LGPLLYRIAYQPLAEASVLVLLIVSVALHFAMVGFGLWFFGAEGSRTPPFSSASFAVGGVNISVQSVLVVGTSVALIGALGVFFGRTLQYVTVRLRLVLEWIQVSDARKFPLGGKSQTQYHPVAAGFCAYAITFCQGQIQRMPDTRKGNVRMLRRIQEPLARKRRNAVI
jgi:hypothetical protein